MKPIAAISILLIPVSAIVAEEESIDFNRDVRPIISDKCFQCHGPDADNQKSDFRLDTRERAIADLGGYAGIVPGDLEASEAHHRIWEDEVLEDRMPPPDSKLTLTDSEKRILDRWISEGANYDQHWSFKPIARPEIPKLSEEDRKWATNPIDHFVVRRLREEGLEPSPAASKETLIRRASLDLTGLPPTPEEVDAFLSDSAEGAWERVVDRLLASSRYGERMALVWLDAARYADSGGYQNDMRRSQWPWRDWVIDAYNANMPFDQFTIEQLAGDLLPHPTRDQRLATAFNRNHRINNEGGIVPDEFIVEYVADRVETTSTVWLGLTMNCSRCHDHKYDPITQKDYYSLFAFFNNIDEHGQDGTSAPTPNMTVYAKGSASEHERLTQDLTSVEERIHELPQRRRQDFQDWIEEQQALRSEKLRPLKSLPIAALHLPLDADVNRTTVDARNSYRKGFLVGRSESEARLVSDATYGSGIRLGRTGYVKVDDAHEGGFDSRQARTWLAQLDAPVRFAGSEGPILVMAEKDTLKGYRIMLEDTGPDKDFRVSFQLMQDHEKEKGIEVVSGPVVKPGKPVRLGVTWDGSNRGKGVHLYVDGEPVPTTILLDSLEESVMSDLPLLIGARAEKDAREFLRDATLNAGVLDDVQIYDTELSREEIVLLSESDPRDLLFAHDSESARLALDSAWIQGDAEGQRLLAELKEREKALNTFESKATVKVSIMKETPGLRETYILKRGAYDQPDTSEALRPRTLEALPPMNPTWPRNRLGLAQWIVDPGNPLTARVAVNRYWQMYFGTGLVKTAEDFGSQGESPSHPELLDWLASAFVDSGWDIKAMQKLIVMSSTYRQSSRVTEELLEKDPENRLLARGPRYRLSGQSIRDQALAASGLLVERMGGPPVMPYQPEGLWDEVSAKGYKYIVGEEDDLYRRSLYTFWRRTVPPPSMMNFDNASREACSVLTTRTNTPLQALNLMNDEQFVEAARSLAERMLQEGGSSLDEQIAYGHRFVLSRKPDADVLDILVRGYSEYLDTYKQHPEKAKDLVTVGASSPSIEIDASKLAAMSVVANVLLNLDETLSKEQLKKMDPITENQLLLNRRQFFGKTATGLGAAALASLLGRDLIAENGPGNAFPNFAPKAKRVIYLFQSGAPSQLDLFDWKPELRKRYATDLPDSIRGDQRVTGMTVGQKRFPIAPTIYDFKRRGESGAWVSELMPHIGRIADKLCFIKSMYTEAINHDPAITFFQTGSQIAGRPSVGSWLSYGLGSMNENLPAFVAMVSTGTGRPGGQPLYDRLWGSGFLPTTHQGIRFRGVGDPVLYLNNPNGMDRSTRRRMLDDLNAINQKKYEESGDPEVATRIAQYELAYRMQTSVPELTDLSSEPESTFEAYGPESRKRGTFANNCILARRLVERDVRFVQLFHMGWDQHKVLPDQIPGQCYDTDQASTALIEDLERRGLLEDTLVIWGGEFGRTVYCQGTLTEDNYGRDHHPRCFTIFMAGAGVKPGITYGETDEFGYNITENPVHVHDLHATLLHLLGIDHERLTYKFQGRRYRLTDVHGHLVKGIMAQKVRIEERTGFPVSRNVVLA